MSNINPPPLSCIVFTPHQNVEQKRTKRIVRNGYYNKDDFILSSKIGGWVYLLKSKKGSKVYIGLTSDLRKRLAKHNLGLTKSTKYRRPLALVYYEAFGSLKDAQIREKKLKNFKNSYAELKKRIINSLQEK